MTAVPPKTRFMSEIPPKTNRNDSDTLNALHQADRPLSLKVYRGGDSTPSSHVGLELTVTQATFCG